MGRAAAQNNANANLFLYIPFFDKLIQGHTYDCPADFEHFTEFAFRRQPIADLCACA
jgi:hypothetical protein